MKVSKTRLNGVPLTALGLALLLGAPFSAFAQGQGTQAAVLRITPAGDDAPVGNQIVLEFASDVAPLGRMARKESEVPFEVTPDPGCAWRWLSPATLACQLDAGRSLEPATRYTVGTKKGESEVEGVRLAAPVMHAFGTERPDVSYTRFRTWLGPRTPLIRVITNQPVYGSSAGGALSFALPGGGASVPARIYSDDYRPDEARTQSTQPVPVAEGEAVDSFLAAPASPLPEDATVHFSLAPGLESARGPERGAAGRVLTEFHTFAPFEFVGVRCTAIRTNDWVLHRPVAPAPPGERCDPLESVGLVFNAPVMPEEIGPNVRISPDLAAGRKDYDPWANRHGYTSLDRPHAKGEEYVIWLPEYLKAYARYELESAAGALRDEFGRSLAAGIDMAFPTDHRRPRLVTTHRDAVLESRIDSEMPIVVTNLDSVHATYDALTATGLERNIERTIGVAGAEDVAFAVPLGVREMLGGRSGVIEGEIHASPSTREGAVPFLAQVTPYEVQTKLGHYDSLVWVVDLETGQPVEDAHVTIVSARLDDLSALVPLHAPARTDASGTARLPGTVDVDPELSLLQAWEDDKPRLMVRVTGGAGHALLPLVYDFRSRNDNVWPDARKRFRHLKTWGTTAQGVYRPGDLVQFKLYVRDESTRALVPPPRGGFSLRILDSQGKAVLEKDEVTLSAFGAYDGELRLADNAAVGWYRFELTRGSAQPQAGRGGNRALTLEPMRMLVSDFTPVPFKVQAQIGGTRFAPGDALELGASAELRSGGAYADAPARLSARLVSRSFSSSHPQARGFSFGVHALDAEHGPGPQTLLDENGTLDGRGEFASTLDVPDSEIYYGRITLQASVRDDRGKSSAAVASAEYAGRDRYVGLRAKRWLYREDETAGVEYIVVDAHGSPTTNVAVRISIAREALLAARVKGAGNAYLTRYERAWQDVGTCADGAVLASRVQAGGCVFVPDEPGLYRVRAHIEDTHGRAQASELHLWVAGKGEVLWDSGDDTSLSIVPEKSRVAVGDTARYLVRNPYPGAQALITVERYGVLKSWVQVFETSTPVVSFEVEPDFVPGFYLSVSIVSPRIEPPPARAAPASAPVPAASLDDSADLGKPAARSGYLRVDVDDPVKQIAVEVTPAREEYEPRERVVVDIHAAPRSGAQDEPMELAVAVLDEAVFDLIQGGDAYFDPYRGFYRLESLDVSTYSLMRRLVGRINFQAKGASQGGDGAGGDAVDFRSLFKFVSYWNPGLRTDSEGRARIEFEAPDNLTAWRVLVMAVTPGERMGLGVGRFRVNRATELRPVMPNQLTSGDKFNATISVMNRTDMPRILRVLLEAGGSALTEPVTQRYTLAMAPYKRRLVSLPLTAGRPGEIQLEVSARDARGADGLRHGLSVSAARPARTAAARGDVTGTPARVTLEVPRDAEPGSASLGLTLSPSVVTDLQGPFEYLRDYPYGCWEQRLSKGIAAGQFGALSAHVGDGFRWPGANTLPAQTLEDSASFQSPNGGMTYFAPRNEYVSPFLSAYTSLAFGWLREAGHEPPAAVADALDGYLDRLLAEDVMPDFYSRGMASTVRAVALAARAGRGGLELVELERYASAAPYMSVFGQAHFLDAARQVKGAQPVVDAALERLLAAVERTPEGATFRQSLDTGQDRILETPLRGNCAALDAVVRLSNEPRYRDRLARLSFDLLNGIAAARRGKNAWSNTQENLYCARALQTYASVFERNAPNMRVSARLDGAVSLDAAFTSFADAPVTRSTPLERTGAAARVLDIAREGEGRAYYVARLAYTPGVQSTERANAGFDIRRELSVLRDDKWVLASAPYTVQRGDTVRVDLFVHAPGPRSFVVVHDPLPGAFETVNRDLATATSAAHDEAADALPEGSYGRRFDNWRVFGRSWQGFYHRELRHDSARFFADYLPAGRYHLSYTAQVIATGEFAMPAVRAEQMYAPEVHGAGLAARITARD